MNRTTKNIEQVIKCAVSNSIDYHADPKAFIYDSALLKSAAIEHITKHTDLSSQEATNLFSDCINSAMAQTKADGHTPFLAAIGSAIGLIATLVNGIIFLTTGFNFVFLLFLVLSISLYKQSDKEVKHSKKLAEAALIWKNNLEQQSSETMRQSLEQMTDILK